MLVQGVRHVLHNYECGAVFHLEVMDTGDVGMVQAGSESSFSLEGFQVLGVVSDRLIDDFDCDDPVQHGIPSPVHRTLAARGYPVKDLVSAYSLEHGCCRGL